MHIAVAILTCDRVELTKRTVKSFLKYNNRNNFKIFYGDDHSIDKSIHRFMGKQNIPCIMKNSKRIGCSPSSDELTRLVQIATKAPYILYLQNDFESVRSIPLSVVEQIFNTNHDVGWIRLYGLNKNDTVPGGNPTDPLNKFKHKSQMVKWDKLKINNEKIEIGDAQWSYNPAIHRTTVLRQLIKGATRERDVGMAAVKSCLLTARFMKNITNHIGINKGTPGGKFGKPYGVHG